MSNLKRMLLAALFVPAASGAAEFAFVTTTDYETGSSAVIRFDGSWTTQIDAASIHSDAISRWHAGLVYVVNRENGDNIQILDPAAGFSTLRQFSTGNGTNPQDIAFVDEAKAYITLYDANHLLIMNTVTGAQLGTIDLSAFADGDGLCENSRLRVVDDHLFVTIQRVDRNYWWGPVGDSYVAVVDCETDSLVDADPSTPGIQAIRLQGANPYSDILYDEASERLFVSCVGWWAVNDGGVEIVNPATLASEGFLLTEAAAGGDIFDFDLSGGGKGYAVVANSSFFTELVSFDRASGMKIATIYAPGAWVINDIGIAPSGELFLADQTVLDPGIRIYDTSDDSEITEGPVDTGLPPYHICFSVPGVTDSEVPAFAGIGAIFPNPFNPSTTIEYSVASAGRVRLEIYDAAGRKIRTLIDGPHGPGNYRASWDGANDWGSPSGSGVYFLRFSSEDAASSGKLVLLR
ncbi:MAG: T9SS type A sorting domain-containing protein [Candidatus Krumholzibacteria bacterium]|nr:T9SS type A sorting domain-containing protein [Candidatus Krumholzibacteria bacterium]